MLETTSSMWATLVAKRFNGEKKKSVSSDLDMAQSLLNLSEENAELLAASAS